jgi:hypothetical protein
MRATNDKNMRVAAQQVAGATRSLETDLKVGGKARVHEIT